MSYHQRRAALKGRAQDRGRKPQQKKYGLVPGVRHAVQNSVPCHSATDLTRIAHSIYMGLRCLLGSYMYSQVMQRVPYLMAEVPTILVPLSISAC